MNSNTRKLQALDDSLWVDNLSRELLVQETPPRNHETRNQMPVTGT